MKSIKKYTVFFIVGAVGYGALELLWRGYTHPTMLIAGGICFMIFSLIADRFYTIPLIIKATLAAVSVTAVELIFGLVFNLGFGLGVWDYTDRPLNLFGQICLPFSLLWCALGIVFIPIAEAINEKFKPYA